MTDLADMKFGRVIDAKETPISQAKSTKEGYTATGEKESEAQANARKRREEAQGSGGAFVRDTGALAKRISVSAHFQGNNYKKDRDAFIEIVEAGGIHELILPTFPPMNARVGEASIKYSNKAGGYEEVMVLFIEDNNEVHPTDNADSKKDAEGTIGAGKVSVLKKFGLTLSSVSSTVSDIATGLTERITEFCDETLGLSAISDGIDSFTALNEELAQTASTLIYRPSTLAGKVYTLFESVNQTFESTTGAFKAQMHIFEGYANGISTYYDDSTESTKAIYFNNISFIQLVNNATLQLAGSALLNSDFKSLDEARAYLSDYEKAVKAQQLLNGNFVGFEELHYALANTLADVSRYVKNQSDLPSVVEREYNFNTQALVQSMDLYGTALRADEIIEQNDVRNPLELPKKLKVLTY